MTDATETVVVARELEALMPAFLANRRQEIDALRAALAAEDFAELRRIAHRMKGVGASYGLTRISEHGARIEDAARAPDRAALVAEVDAYAEYLGKVRIAYD